MAHTRAMLASIGASVVLVAAAALGLLAISAVFAFGGWADPVTTSVARPALIVAATTPGAREPTKRSPVVLPAPKRAHPRPAARPSAPTRPAAQTTHHPAIGGVTGSARVAVQPTEHPEPPAAPSAPAAGDGVRKVGKDLSGTVQSAGSALAEATQPLGPPISAAVQQVLNVIAALLRRSTDGVGNVVDGVGGTVDGLLAPK